MPVGVDEPGQHDHARRVDDLDVRGSGLREPRGMRRPRRLGEFRRPADVASPGPTAVMTPSSTSTSVPGRTRGSGSVSITVPPVMRVRTEVPFRNSNQESFLKAIR
nr:hypothetical protein GCM10020093_044440 [Planobispora longispora]